MHRNGQTINHPVNREIILEASADNISLFLMAFMMVATLASGTLMKAGSPFT